MRSLVNLALGIAINGVAIGVTALVLPGITVVPHTVTTFLLIGIVFGLVNAIIRPVVSFFSFPLTVLTLGIFQLVISALMLLLVGWLLPQNLQIAGFLTALVGGIIMGIVGGILQWFHKQINKSWTEHDAMRRMDERTNRRIVDSQVQ
jgi:putative membrane protein